MLLSNSRRFISFAAMVSAMALCAACANVPLTQTGYLGDYSNLKDAPELEVWGVPDSVRLYRSEELDEGKYDAVMVEPSVWVQSEEDEFKPTEEKTAWLLEEFSMCLENGLSEDFEIVDSPREGALIVRPAMTAVDPANVWINTLFLFLLVPVDMGGISGEIDVVDSMSGERVLAMTARREGNPFLFLETFTRYGQSRHGMYKWSLMLSDLLQPQGS